MTGPKFLYWVNCRAGYKAVTPLGAGGNHISPNSGLAINLDFNGLPEARAYKLKLEQFSINSTGVGAAYDMPDAQGGPPVAGQPCATGLIEVEGFLPASAVVYATSDVDTPVVPAGGPGAVGPPKQRCILSRFDTSFMSGANVQDCTVAPPHTPTCLIHKPQNGSYNFYLRGILNERGFLVIQTAGGGAARRPVGDWIMCLSIEPLTDSAVDAYYNPTHR